MILKLIFASQSKQLTPQDAILQPRKLDWLISDRADDIVAIMNDNATFVRFPSLGSTTSIITVYGDHIVNVSRTIRSIMQLVSPLLLTRNLKVDFGSGLCLLLGWLLAATDPVQRSLTPCAATSSSCSAIYGSNLLQYRRRDHIQRQLLRSTRNGDRSSSRCRLLDGSGHSQGTLLIMTLSQFF